MTDKEYRDNISRTQKYKGLKDALNELQEAKEKLYTVDKDGSGMIKICRTGRNSVYDEDYWTNIWVTHGNKEYRITLNNVNFLKIVKDILPEYIDNEEKSLKKQIEEL